MNYTVNGSDRTTSCDVCNMHGYISFLPSEMILLVGKLPFKREISPDKNVKILNTFLNHRL